MKSIVIISVAALLAGCSKPDDPRIAKLEARVAALEAAQATNSIAKAVDQNTEDTSNLLNVVEAMVKGTKDLNTRLSKIEDEKAVLHAVEINQLNGTKDKVSGMMYSKTWKLGTLDPETGLPWTINDKPKN